MKLQISDPSKPKNESVVATDLQPTDWYGFSLISGSLLLLYLLTQCDALSPAHDSVLYLRMIEEGRYFHPHHLLYNGAAAVWLKSWRIVIPSAEPVMIISWMNAVCGALSMGVVFLLLRARVLLDRKRAMISVLLPALSFGVWFYSVTIEVYIPALLFLLLSFYVLTKPLCNQRCAATAGGLHGVAMLFHQIHILFIITALFVFVPVIIRATDAKERNHALRTAFVYILAASLTSVIPYVFIGTTVLGHNTPDAFIGWLLSYATEGKYWLQPGVSTVIHVAIGFTRSLIGGDFVFATGTMLTLIQTVLPTKWLADQLFAVRYMPSWLAWTLVMALFAFAAMLLLQIGRLFVKKNFRLGSKNRLLSITIVFFLSYSAFFIFWEPGNVEFWIPQSVLFWITFLLLFYKNTSHSALCRKDGPIIILALLLFLINGCGSILWLMPKENDYYAVQAAALKEAADTNGIIVVYDPYMVALFLGASYNHRLVSLSDTLSACNGDIDCTLDIVERRLLREKATGVPIIFQGEFLDADVPGMPKPSEQQTRIAERMTSLFSKEWKSCRFEAGVVYIVAMDALKNR